MGIVAQVIPSLFIYICIIYHDVTSLVLDIFNFDLISFLFINLASDLLIFLILSQNHIFRFISLIFLLLFCFYRGGNWAQSGAVTSPSSHREEVAELRFEPRSYQTAQPMLSSPIKYPPP